MFIFHSHTGYQAVVLRAVAVSLPHYVASTDPLSLNVLYGRQMAVFCVSLLHPCRFVGGGAPGNSSLFRVTPSDWQHMSACNNVVVVSAVFGK